jgi:hypothetical protein
MNSTEIDLYTQLSKTKIYKERFGKWQVGDKVWRKSTVFGEEIDSQIWPEDKRIELITVRSNSELTTASYWHCFTGNGDDSTMKQ